MSVYDIAKALVPFIVYGASILLHSYNIGIFKNKLVYLTICFIAALFMSKLSAAVLIIPLYTYVFFKYFCEKKNIINFKEYITDDSVIGYHLIFNLINNSEISHIATVEGFYNIKKWFESSDESNYLINEPKDNKFITLNKANIVEFSYSTITKRKTLLNPLLYLFTIPAPNKLDVFNYVRGIFATLIIFTLSQMYMLKIDVSTVLYDKDMIINLFSSSISFITMIFIGYYIIFFTLKILSKPIQVNDYIHKVTFQSRNKIYNYASFNFALICLLGIGILKGL